MPTHQIAGVKVYSIDLFDTANATVTAMNAAGLVPICYFSTQFENWRPDSASFPASALGSIISGWAGERYVDTRTAEIRNIMTARIQLCKAKGFKAIDPDNTDCYGTCNSGFPLTSTTALQYLQFLSDTARANGMGIGLKNTLNLISSTTVSMWDFAINEQCYQHNECGMYAPFKAAGKPIFNVEYTSLSKFNSNACAKVNTYGTVSIRKALSLQFTPRDACALPKLASPSPSPKPSPRPSPKPSPSPSPKLSPRPSPKPSPKPSPSPSPKHSPSPSPKPSPSPSPKFWQLVYEVPPTPEALYKALMLSKARRAGWVYVTDDSITPDGNPWDTLPSAPGLWDLEVRLTSTTQQIGVPSYYYPCFTSTATCHWSRTSGNDATRVVIINPASGPGTAVDSNYVTIVNNMKAAGLIVLAYTYTGYGARAAATVQADIDKYYNFYQNISGIFLDEGSTDCVTLPYYQQLVAYTKSKAQNSLTALNWGTQGPECFLSAAANTPDIIINFEDTYSAYSSWSGPAAWTAAYPAHRFWHLVHSAPANAVAFGSALGLARARHAGWVYVTNDVMNNPWDTLPAAALWSNETAIV
ncbi:hypothetical protein OEZ85_014412 [Tetradesmus obliquus]|uniref:Glycoside-hydrolase family GH114 TIM-barrel domain-containing protein n=1 Tax=Tetradesmus obliquus TaxID=3088 RepID=A0ABY8U7Z8_TETOB|nr:hypothetical protein OEZ85_014412 [Tetradesmus obliquus]